VRPISSSVTARAEPPALRLDGSKVTRLFPVPHRSFGHLIRSAQGLHLADVDVWSQKRRRFSLRLEYIFSAQVLQINGRLCHLVLAFPYVGDIANGRALARGHYSASSLLRTQPPPSRLRPASRFRRLYGYLLRRFRAGRGGLLQLLSMSMSPCCRFHPAEVNIRIGQSSAAHAAFALRLKARPSGYSFRGHNAFTFVTAR